MIPYFQMSTVEEALANRMNVDIFSSYYTPYPTVVPKEKTSQIIKPKQRAKQDKKEIEDQYNWLDGGRRLVEFSRTDQFVGNWRFRTHTQKFKGKTRPRPAIEIQVGSKLFPQMNDLTITVHWSQKLATMGSFMADPISIRDAYGDIDVFYIEPYIKSLYDAVQNLPNLFLGKKDYSDFQAQMGPLFTPLITQIEIDRRLDRNRFEQMFMDNLFVTSLPRADFPNVDRNGSWRRLSKTEREDLRNAKRWLWKYGIRRTAPNTMKVKTTSRSRNELRYNDGQEITMAELDSLWIYGTFEIPLNSIEISLNPERFLKRNPLYDAKDERNLNNIETTFKPFWGQPQGFLPPARLGSQWDFSPKPHQEVADISDGMLYFKSDDGEPGGILPLKIQAKDVEIIHGPSYQQLRIK